MVLQNFVNDDAKLAVKFKFKVLFKVKRSAKDVCRQRVSDSQSDNVDVCL